MKKVMVLMMVGAMVLTLGVGNAVAAFGWIPCTISQAGSGIFGMSFITCSSAVGVTPAFTDVQFYIYDSFVNSKASLAAALTAYSNSKNVTIYIDNAPPTSGAPCYGVIAMP